MSGYFNFGNWKKKKTRADAINAAVSGAAEGKKADKPTLGNPEGTKKKKKK